LRQGFTLVELAVVLAIVALLLSSLMYTLSAQIEQRNFEETRRRLDQARDLVFAFAIVNGRLPCPARSNSGGFETRDAAGNCTSAGVDDYYGGTIAAGVTGGLLPAGTVGYQQVDSGGFALDAWQRRIRYAVAKTNTNCSTAPPANTRLFTHAANLKTYGLSCQPNDLVVCKSATGITASACGGAGNQIMTQDLVVAIIVSTGKNGATGGTGADEAANLNGDPVFVFHTATPSAAVNGEFDDQFTWIIVGELYGKLIAAGVLP
jgi:prepilin-type N-terminal cleavage/methylation domain-containing protein